MDQENVVFIHSGILLSHKEVPPLKELKRRKIEKKKKALPELLKKHIQKNYFEWVNFKAAL
jgi:hypothetical protein